MLAFNDIRVKTIKETDQNGQYEISPLPKGYGSTLANALRRILLSSLPGAAITSIKIDGVKHEYTTIEGIREDILEIILNIKNIRFSMLTDEPQTCVLDVKGMKTITAKDIKVTGAVEVMNPELELAHLTAKDAKLKIEFTIEKGKGYKHADESNRTEIGRIPLDADFSPITNVRIETHNTRKGQETELDAVDIEITTDKSIAPKDALMQSARILQDFAGNVMVALGMSKPEVEQLAETSAEGHEDTVEESVAVKADSSVIDMKIEDLNISKRAKTGLLNGNYEKVEDLTNITVKDLSKLPGFGSKSLNEVVNALAELGITLSE